MYKVQNGDTNIDDHRGISVLMFGVITIKGSLLFVDYSTFLPEQIEDMLSGAVLDSKLTGSRPDGPFFFHYEGNELFASLNQQEKVHQRRFSHNFFS